MTTKLSPPMEKALAKLTAEWQSQEKLQHSRTTLDALVRRSLAEREWHFWEHSAWHYRRKQDDN